MDLTLSTKKEEDFLLAKASGKIADSDELQLFTKRFYDEIVKYGFERIVIDVSKVDFPISLQLHDDIVSFYKEELPPEIRFFKIAVVDESSYKEIGKYWEFVAKQKGFDKYKVFFSMQEAHEFIKG